MRYRRSYRRPRRGFRSRRRRVGRRYIRRRLRRGSRRVRSWRRRGVTGVKWSKFNNAVVPSEIYVKCKYTKAGQLTVANLNNTSGSFGILYQNDPFDPDPDLGNLSAQGFDFWRDYYGSYICTSARVTVDFYNQNNSQGLTGYLLVSEGLLGPSIVGTTPVDYLQNLPNIKWRNMGPTNSGRYKCRLSNIASTRRVRAATNRGTYWEDTAWSAATNASPSTRPLIYIIAGTQTGGPNSTGATLACEWKATITYNVRFYNRKLTPETQDPE